MREAAVGEVGPRRPAVSAPPPGRLRAKAEFSHVFARPDRVLPGRFFKVLARRNALSLARLGLAIARKHSRTAVRRNLLKRLSREAVRRQREGLTGWDVVILSRPPAGEGDRRELRRELDDLLARLSRL